MTPAFTLPSPETGTSYVIYVEPPEAGEQSDARNGPPPRGVLFMDGDDQFKFARAAYRALRADGRVAPLRLVGVGYGASYAKPGNRRGRDYTPGRTPMSRRAAERTPSSLSSPIPSGRNSNAAIRSIARTAASRGTRSARCSPSTPFFKRNRSSRITSPARLRFGGPTARSCAISPLFAPGNRRSRDTCSSPSVRPTRAP